jgi:outer membrane protein OmpA-like peptidoglycan-associated protein
VGHLSAYLGPGEAHAASPAESRRVSNSQRMPDALLALQRTAGNAAVNRLMIQRQSLGGGGGLRGGGAQLTSSTTTETLTGFATSSADLTPAHQEALARIAADLNAQPLVFGGFVTLVGFADRRGDPGENQALGQHRADAVRDHLQQLVTDEATKQQIRAYSLGAPREGPGGDVPSLRKVEITITRRSYNLPLPNTLAARAARRTVAFRPRHHTATAAPDTEPGPAAPATAGLVLASTAAAAPGAVSHFPGFPLAKRNIAHARSGPSRGQRCGRLRFQPGPGAAVAGGRLSERRGVSREGTTERDDPGGRGTTEQPAVQSLRASG